jgi:hypothetical protein
MDRFAPSWALPISRQRLYFWVLLLGFANVLVDKAVRSVAMLGWAISLGELFQVSAIVFAAIAVSLILIANSSETASATGSDTAVALVVVACTLPPVGLFSRVAVAGAALFLLWSSPRRSAEWRGAAIAVSTSAHFLFGPVLLKLFAAELAFMDAWLVAQMTGLEQHGDLVAMNGEAAWLQIFGPCSSLHAISLSLVLPVAYSQWFGIDDWRLIIQVIIGTAMTTAAFNVTRLAAMAEWPPYYDLLHVGWGSSVIATATLVVMLLICLRGFDRAER